MSPTPVVTRIGGAALGVGGALFIATKLDAMSRVFLGRTIDDVVAGDDTALIAIGQLALAFGYVTFLRRFGPRAGRLGRSGLRLMCAGGIGLAVGHVSFMSGLPLPPAARPAQEAFFAFVIVGLLGLIVGLALFGYSALRRAELPRARWLPLATGAAGFLAFIVFSGEVVTGPFLVFRTLFALGIVGLGVVLWTDAARGGAAAAQGRMPTLK